MTPFVPTQHMRTAVWAWAGAGLTREEIRVRVINPRTGAPIDVNTLSKHFEVELRDAARTMDAKVAESLYRKATSATHPQAVAAATFWLKCRAGWRGTDRVVHEVSGSISGVMVAPATATVQDWVAQQVEKNDSRKPPNLAGPGESKPTG